jgi:hypothetical protein
MHQVAYRYLRCYLEGLFVAAELRRVCLVFVLAVVRCTGAAAFAGGTGELSDPYRTAMVDQLVSIESAPNLLDKHFILMADLNLAPNLPSERTSKAATGEHTAVSDNNRTDLSMSASTEGLIPVVSAIIGGLITLAGVLLTLRWNERSNQSRLMEERRKTKEEREFASKQAAFMAASEAAIRYIHYFLSLADRPLPTDGAVVEEVTDLAVALSRLHFYCGIETVEKAIQLGRVLDNALAEALTAKMAPSFSTEDLKCIEVQLSGFENTNAHIQEEIVAMLQSDPQNPLLVSHRERSAEVYEEMAALCERKCEIIRQQFVETEKCRDAIQRNTRAIYEASRDVLLLARRELSFPIDEARYKDVMDQYLGEGAKQSADMFTELRRQCLQKMDGFKDETKQDQ